MTSLFEHLLETMPLAGAYSALQASFNGPFRSQWKKLDRITLDEAKLFLRYLSPERDYTAQIPPVNKTHEPVVQRLWGWQHKASDLTKISEITCRVRDADYAS